MQSCCSPIASACSPPIASPSAAARHLRPLRAAFRPDFIRFNCTATPRLHLLPAAAPRLRPLQLLRLPDCVRFGCGTPIASASAAAPRLRPLQLLLARLRPLRLLLLDCMHPLAPPAGFQSNAESNVLEHSSQSLRFSEYIKVRRSRVTIV